MKGCLCLQPLRAKIELTPCSLGKVPIQTQMTTPILISIEGNIGAGKSTLLQKLKAAHPEWFFVDEPVAQWMALQNADGTSLLELFYKDKQRWSYTFQNVAVLTRAEELRKTLDLAAESGTESPVIVMERCLDTDAEVFARMLKDEGCLNQIEWDLYQRWRKVLIETFNLPKTTGYIWMDASPLVCAERIKMRARHGEEDIPLGYLEELDDAHIEWLQSVDSFTRQSSWSKNLQDDLEAVDAFVNRLVSNVEGPSSNRCKYECYHSSH